jgi:hypothetical protein
MFERESPLSAELEAALVRQLVLAWRGLNDGYFKGRMKLPALLLTDGNARLGQWIAGERRIELSRRMVLDQPWGVVIEVLKHEMAHQFVHEVLGDPDATPHGSTFRAVCEAHGIDAAAAGLPRAADAEENRILARVAKLLALAESPNQHEAEAAMTEAQRLMLKHNLEHIAQSSYSFRHLGQPTGRVTEAERILANILDEHFFVECIWVPVWRARQGKRGSVLEACGASVNLEIAEHTYAFLVHTAERLWQAYRRAHAISGNRDRRTFAAGVMTGFKEKLDAERKKQERAGLVWIGDGDLDKYYRRRHPHIRWTRHAGGERNEAHAHGRAAGRNIVLHRAVHERVERGRLLPARR